MSESTRQREMGTMGKGIRLGRGATVHADSVEGQPWDSVTRCGRSADMIKGVKEAVTCKSCLKLLEGDARKAQSTTEALAAMDARAAAAGAEYAATDAEHIPATVHGIAYKPMDGTRWVPMGPAHSTYHGTEVAFRQIEILARDIPENAFCVYEVETGRVVAEIVYGAMEFDTGEFLIMDEPEVPTESFKVQTFRDGEWNTLGTYGPWTHHDAAERFAEESYRENGAPYRVVNTATGEVGATFGVPPLMSTPAPVLKREAPNPETGYWARENARQASQWATEPKSALVVGRGSYGSRVDLRDAAAGRADGPVRWRAPRGKRKIHTVRRYRRG